jgi:16S rRNA C1402 (ribose-2'-O) methylase RsmI
MGFLQVNQIPGASSFASKALLAQASSDLPFLPQSFVVPKQSATFQEAASVNPDMEWLVKGSDHRGVTFLANASQLVEQVQEVSGVEPTKFIQQLVRPYLIDG